jgi:hypothetical protein
MVSVVKFMKFLRSSNSVEIWLICQFDYSKQESETQIFALRSGDFFIIFFVNGKVVSSENVIVSYSGS